MKTLSQIYNKFFQKDSKIIERTTTINKYMSFEDMPWSKRSGRRRKWEDLQDMDSSDGIVAQGLNVIANKAIINPNGSNLSNFEVKTKDDGEIINSLIKRTKIQMKIWEIARKSLLDGDMFCELIYDDKYQMQDIRIIPDSWTVHINQDKNGALLTGNPAEAIGSQGGISAYEQFDSMGNTVVSAFYPFQIAHFKLGEQKSGPYVEPILGKSITLWKRYQAKLDALAVARLTRAFSQRVHKVPVPQQDSFDDKVHKIQEYRKALTEDIVPSFDSSQAKFQFSKRNVVGNVTSDYYVARIYDRTGKIVDTEIENLEASPAQLRELEDIILDIKILLVTIGVPMHEIGLNIGQKSFVDKSSDKAEEGLLYNVLRLQMALCEGLKHIFDCQLTLSGIDPEKYEYEIVMPRISPHATESTAKVELMRTQAASTALSAGIPISIIAKRYLGMTKEEAEEWSQSEKKKSDAVPQETDKDKDEDKPEEPKPTQK